MTLTRADIANDIHENCALTKSQSADLAESIFELIKSTLEDGEDVLISGFGKSCVKEKKTKRGKKSCDRRGLNARQQACCDF
jgi:integration host factor subunit alpha